jgi:hypothetical protein
LEEDFNIAADDLDYGCEDVDAEGIGFQFQEDHSTTASVPGASLGTSTYALSSYI